MAIFVPKYVWANDLSAVIKSSNPNIKLYSLQNAKNANFLNFQDKIKNEIKLPSDLYEVKKNDGKETLYLQIRNGGGSDGGLFDAQMTSYFYINYAIKDFVNILKIIDLNNLNKLLIENGFHVNWNEFIQILGNYKIAPDTNIIGLNKDGHQIYKLMHYDLEKREIYFLKSFLKKYDKPELSLAEKKSVYLSILHEMSHLFNIGINNLKSNDDSKSRVFANLVYDYIHLYFGTCGMDDKENRVQKMNSCSHLQIPDLSYKTFKWQLLSSYNFTVNEFDFTNVFQRLIETSTGAVLYTYNEKKFDYLNIGTYSEFNLRNKSCQNLELVFPNSKIRLPNIQEAEALQKYFILENPYRSYREDSRYQESGNLLHYLNFDNKLSYSNCIPTENNVLVCPDGSRINYNKESFKNYALGIGGNIKTICISHNTFDLFVKKTNERFQSDLIKVYLPKNSISFFEDLKVYSKLINWILNSVAKNQVQ